MTRPSTPGIILAVDVNRSADALELVNTLGDKIDAYKFGLEFFSGLVSTMLTARPQEADIELRDARTLFHTLRGRYFHDGKLCDIPNTVGQAAGQIARLHPWALNVHASAGAKAIATAVANKGESLVLGVTVLTSIKGGDDGECMPIFGDEPSKKVLQFAEMLADNGADGVICSAAEAEMLRSNQKTSELLLVTPGIRPTWAESNDQQRPVTPYDAVRAGVDYMVIGRPITKPPQSIGASLEAVRLIRGEIEDAMAPAA